MTSSSVSAPRPSHQDELFMQQRMEFSKSLNELKNLRKQLNSAAEYFELSYRKNDQKQIVVETLKDYTNKTFVNTLDHIGFMADKINSFMDEQIVQVTTTELEFGRIEQRLKTCQSFTDHCGLFEQTLAFCFPKYHKRYIIPVGSTVTAVNQSNLMYQSVDEDGFRFNGKSMGISPTSEELFFASTEFPKSSPKTFQFTRIVPDPEREKRALSSRHVRRSTTINSNSPKQHYPIERCRSVSMPLHSERDKTKSPEGQSSLNKNRLLKALVSIRKHNKEASFQKIFS